MGIFFNRSDYLPSNNNINEEYEEWVEEGIVDKAKDTAGAVIDKVKSNTRNVIDAAKKTKDNLFNKGSDKKKRVLKQEKPKEDDDDDDKVKPVPEPTPTPKKESGGFFFTREEEQRILNELQIKTAASDTSASGFGTDPDGSYNAGGGGGGAGGGGNDAQPEEDSAPEPLPDDGGDEQAAGDDAGEGAGGDSPEPLPDDGGSEGGDDSPEPLPDDGGDGGDTGEEGLDGGPEPLPDDGGGEDMGDAGGDGGDAPEPLPDDGGEGGGEEDAGDEEGTEDGEETEEGEGEEKKSLDEEIKNLERILFSSISPEQMKEKVYRLKRDYMDLYETVVKLYDDIIKIPRNSNTQTVLDFLNKKVLQLKELISYNMLKNFDNKTYMENTLTYQECLAALNSINNIIAELNKANAPSEEDEEKTKEEELGFNYNA